MFHVDLFSYITRTAIGALVAIAVVAVLSIVCCAPAGAQVGLGPVCGGLNSKDARCQPIPYIGVCDIVSCAVAYDVSRAATRNYAGNLFQLFDGTATHDIGQTPGHMANTAAAVALCGSGTNHGIYTSYTTCVYSAFYDQINGNTLIPSVLAGTGSGLNDTPNCAGGGAYKCAATFTIDNASGFPVIDTNYGNPGVLAPEYYIAADATATGVTGGTQPTSVVAVETPLPVVSTCCGSFLLSQLATPGVGNGATDLGPAPQYDWNNTYRRCYSGTGSCLFEEGGSTWGQLTPNAWGVFTSSVNSSGYTQDYLNGVQLKCPPATGGQCPTSPGSTPHTSTSTHIHLGGGGNLDQPGPFYGFGGYIFNSQLTASQNTTIARNVAGAYPSLTFAPPSPPTGATNPIVTDLGDVYAPGGCLAQCTLALNASAPAGSQLVVYVLYFPAGAVSGLSFTVTDSNNDVCVYRHDSENVGNGGNTAAVPVLTYEFICPNIGASVTTAKVTANHTDNLEIGAVNITYPSVMQPLSDATTPGPNPTFTEVGNGASNAAGNASITVSTSATTVYVNDTMLVIAFCGGGGIGSFSAGWTAGAFGPIAFKQLSAVGSQSVTASWTTGSGCGAVIDAFIS